MTSCRLCEKRPVESWFGMWCVSCRKIKHYLNVYDERVIDILDKQENKIKMEIQTEIDVKECALKKKHIRKCDREK